MLSVVFWNLMKAKRAQLVGQLAQQTSADIVILVECEDSDSELRDALYLSTQRSFQKSQAYSTKVHVYSDMPLRSVRPVQDGLGERLSIHRIVLKTTDILLASVHMPSKLTSTDFDQIQFAGMLANSIRRSESDFKHERTVLVGDMNMNPFDPGMIAATGLHGVMCQRIAGERCRTVSEKQYPYFYNPMWGLLGDRTPGPAGTHYYRRGSLTEVFWNTFDQILIRPDLLNVFHGVDVITTISTSALLTDKGYPNRSIGSDHLPLHFRLNLERDSPNVSADTKPLEVASG